MATVSLTPSLGTAPEVAPPSIAALAQQLAELQAAVKKIETALPVDRISIVVFSATLDQQLAALTIATAAAASGMEVEMFFTFWGFSALRDAKKHAAGKPLVARLFGWMLPKGTRQFPLSQMHMAGAGSSMMRSLMKRNRVASLEELFSVAAELGVKVAACEMSMGLLGFQRQELIDYPGLSYCGAAHFVTRATAGKTTLFI